MINIVFETDAGRFTGKLNDSVAAQEFFALLPLTLTLEDYAATEKVSDLPVRLNTSDSPAGTAARAGDITYYAPWGNLAIFYKDFRYAEGLVCLGTLDDGAEGMLFKGSKKVNISVME